MWNSLRMRHIQEKLGRNEGHFTLDAEKDFRPYIQSHSSVVTEMCHMALPAHALRAVQVRLK
jgi:hypothetical protein